MNRCMFVGVVATDPEIQGDGDQKRARFRLRVTRPFKNKETDKYDSDFLTVVAWGPRADFVERNLAKGKWVGIEASYRENTVEGEDGSRRTFPQFVVDQFTMIFANDSDSRSSADADEQQEPPARAAKVVRSAARPKAVARPKPVRPATAKVAVGAVAVPDEDGDEEEEAPW